MQTLRTRADESGNCIAWGADWGFNMRIQAEDSEVPGNQEKICWSKDSAAVQAALLFIHRRGEFWDMPESPRQARNWLLNLTQLAESGGLAGIYPRAAVLEL
jgi:hypothetical protein